MSGLAVTLLLIAAIACGLVSVTLLAMLRAAAHGDARLERELASAQERPERRPVSTETIMSERPTGRFARRGSRTPEVEDHHPLAH